MSSKAIPLGAAARIAFLTNDETLLPPVQEFLASSFHITLLNSREEILSLLEEVALEAIVVDIDLPAGGSDAGLDLVKELREMDSDLILVGLTRSRSRLVRKKAEAAGTDDFFVAPVDFAELQGVLLHLLETLRQEMENRLLREEALNRYSFCELIGGSEPMRLVYDAITRVAQSTTSVLIRGESGTGKELVARAIVASGPRPDKPFVSVNCAALPESLIETELFGHEKGAFTGADHARAGHIETAHGGTLFLD